MKKPFILLFSLVLGFGAGVARAQEFDQNSDSIPVRVISERLVYPGQAEAGAGIGVGNEANGPQLRHIEIFQGQPRSAERWHWMDGHWTGIGIHYDGLVKSLLDLSLPSEAAFMKQQGKSVGVNLQLVDVVLTSSRDFGLVTGLGLEINNFRFDRNIGLVQNSAGVVVENTYYTTAGIDLMKSKLTTFYLNVPLLAEFHFGRQKSNWKRLGFVNFGPIVGIRLGGHTKVKSASPSLHGVFKQRDGLNLRNFHLGGEFNVGYHNFAFSVRYYPQSIFATGLGPNVHQVNVGVSVLF